MLSGKWKASILWHLGKGPLRFNDLVRQFKGTSKKIIDQKLKELEQESLVERNVLSDKPLAVIYKITESGNTALEILKMLKAWVDKRD